MKKKDLILYYQNKLYELEYGYWELHTGIWNSISMIDNNNTEFPLKIYKNYYEIPLQSHNITKYVLYINGLECNSFIGKIITNKRYNRPASYDILIYHNNEKYPIHYTYKFGEYVLINYKKLNNDYVKSVCELNDKIMYLNSTLYLLLNSDKNTTNNNIDDTNNNIDDTNTKNNEEYLYYCLKPIDSQDLVESLTNIQHKSKLLI